MTRIGGVWLIFSYRRLSLRRVAGRAPRPATIARYCLGVALLFEPEELLGAAVLPLDGALPPAEGEVLGVAGLVAALEPLLPDELFWLELELSHAASESAESTAAAINHVCFITRSMRVIACKKAWPPGQRPHTANRSEQPKLRRQIFHTAVARHAPVAVASGRGRSTSAYVVRLARKMPRKISAAPTRWKSAMRSSRKT